MHSTIGDILVRSARRTPDAVALHFGDRSRTYRALDEGTARVAQALLSLGLRKGDRVAAFAKNSDAYVLLWLGAVKAGLVHVPINNALSGVELHYIVTQCGARALFCDLPLASVADQAGVKVEIRGSLQGNPDGPDVLTWAMASTPARAPEVELHDSDLAQILYTSGTTAQAKGAMLTHRALVHHYSSAAIACDFTPKQRQLHALPLYHSAQMHVFLMPSLMIGATAWLLEIPAPQLVLDAIARHRLDAFFAPPTVWIALLAQLEKDVSRAATLEKAYYGASIMPVPILQQLRKLLPKLGFYNCFGQSEIGPLATVLRPEEHDARPASAGRSVPFVELRVVDDAMQDVKPSEVGEVVYRSPQLCEGYWDKPEQTEEAFAGGWFHSGDLATLDAEGYLTIVDRKKDVVKTGGVIVGSREVEEALLTHPAVREVAVIPLPDPKWIEAVTAVVVLKEGHSATEEVLIEHTRSTLAAFKTPKRVHFVEALPRNAAGKILKRVLREQLGPVSEGQHKPG